MARSPLVRIKTSVLPLFKTAQGEIMEFGSKPVPVTITIGEGADAITLRTTINSKDTEIMRALAPV